ncbi:MAG: hypothetical protein ABI824_14535 [Acidobacteriota bacterium]
MKRRFEPPSNEMEEFSDRHLASMLKSLPQRVPPARLTSSLLALATREHQRALAPALKLRFPTRWYDRLQLDIQNLMRPLAVPFAGGVFSAVALFSLFVVPAYPVLAIQGRADVPTGLSTTAQIYRTSSATGMSGAEVVVDILVDGQGRMIDYVIVSGGTNLKDPHIRTGLENVLLFTEFVPATAFGQPKSGRVRLSLHSSSINVKG